MYAMRRTHTAVVARVDQMRVLASPVRQELLDALSQLGSASLVELGAVLGRPADGLYYHVRLLERVGLIRAAPARIRGGRREALFRAGARRYAMRYASAPASTEQAVNGVIASMLRLGIRDFRRALANGGNRLDGPVRDLWALRTVGWLRSAQVRKVNRAIHDLWRDVSRHDRGGRLYAVTVLLTPLDHRSNRTGRRPRRTSTP